MGQVNKHNNEFHVYHLERHEQEKKLMRTQTHEAVQEIEAAEKGNKTVKMSAKRKKELAARKAMIQKQKADLEAVVCKLEKSVDDANFEVGQLEEAYKVILAAVVAGGGPDKTNELRQNQEDVQAKKETRKDLKGQLQRKQAELDTFGDAESHPNPLHGADKYSLPSPTSVV